VPPLAPDAIELVLRPRRAWIAVAVVVPLACVAWALVVGLAGDDSAAFGDVVLATPFLVAWLYLVRRWSRCRVVVADGVVRSRGVFTVDELPLASVTGIAVSRDTWGVPHLSAHGPVTATGVHDISICPWTWDHADELEVVLALAVEDREVDATPATRRRLHAVAVRHRS
jgi:hypothetical protein